MSYKRVLADLIKRAAILLSAFAILTFLTPAIRAQQVAVAQLDGYVSDPSGQAIANAQVKAIEVDRNEVRLSTTDITGHYSFPGLPAGGYRLAEDIADMRAT